MSALVRVDNAAFKREVLEAEVPVLVDFTAPWCGPCQKVDAVLENLAEELDGKIKIAQIDLDANSDIASQFGVQGLPTLLLLYRGHELGRISTASKESLKTWIARKLAENQPTLP